MVDELHVYHAISSLLFQRREQREGAEKYLHSLLLEIPRKSIEPMVLALDSAHSNAGRTLQWFISEGTWEDEALLRRHGQAVDQEWGDDDGVLTLDGSELLKQGQESVGVKRQCGGAVGRPVKAPFRILPEHPVRDRNPAQIAATRSLGLGCDSIFSGHDLA